MADGSRSSNVLPVVSAVGGGGAALLAILTFVGIDVPTLNRLPTEVSKIEAENAELRARIRKLETDMARVNAIANRAMESIEFLVPEYLDHEHPITRPTEGR